MLRKGPPRPDGPADADIEYDACAALEPEERFERDPDFDIVDRSDQETQTVRVALLRFLSFLQPFWLRLNQVETKSARVADLILARHVTLLLPPHFASTRRISRGKPIRNTVRICGCIGCKETYLYMSKKSVDTFGLYYSPVFRYTKIAQVYTLRLLLAVKNPAILHFLNF